MALILKKGELDTLLSSADQNRPETIDYLDVACRRFIARAPLVCLATSDKRRHQHLSPIGGAPGFVEVLDKRTLVLPEWPVPESRERLRGVLDDANVALLFMVPGDDCALQVTGSACLSNDRRFIDHFRRGGAAPDVVLLIEVSTATFVGAGALSIGNLWDPPAPSAPGPMDADTP
ncbi:MAG: pyridoxamine 5'-phosphate oxidase family protein, partial [Sphingomonadales bacterium]